MIKIFKILICGLLVAFVSGCISSTPDFGQKSAGPSSDKSTPSGQTMTKALQNDIKFIKVENLPIHTKAVLAAVLQKIRKQKITVEGVKFDPNGSHEIDSEYSDFTGYNVEALEIDWEKIVPTRQKTNIVFLRGVFTFMNEIGQTLSEKFFVDYTVAPKKPIVINNSVTVPLYTDAPTVVGFFIDHKLLASATPYLSTFKDFYLFASLNNINMHATEEEKLNNEKYENLSFFNKMKNTDLLVKPVDSEFAFLAFCMDRISPLGSFLIKISKNPSGAGLSGVEPESLMFDDGFTIGLIQGKGKLFDLKAKFYIQAHYTKDNNATDPAKVALFSSLKFFGPVTPLTAPPGGEWIQNKIAAAGQVKTEQVPKNSVVSRFLNPKNIDDAKLIQQALKDRGYYTSKIDGLFGKGSLRALQAFRKDVMGDDSAKWDMKTQKKLFP